MHKTIHDSGFQITNEDRNFKYQEDLTKKLDADTSDFDQNRLNEIVLWKVNRYAAFSEDLISELNQIPPEDSTLNEELTRKVLLKLLKTNGVQLAMASTILRFRNPGIYQIIDQRVFRILYPDQELKLHGYDSDNNRNKQAELYLKYLKDLRESCEMLNIPFEESDRILFMADKRINKHVKLKNYGSSK